MTMLRFSTILAIAQLDSATTTRQMAASSMPIKGALIPPWSMLVWGSMPCCFRDSAVLPFGLSGQSGSNHPNYDGCYPIAAEILVDYMQANEVSNWSPRPVWPIWTLGRAFSGHYGFQIGRLVVAMGWQRQPPSRQWWSMADALFVVANDWHDLYGAQQPPRPGAATRSNTPARSIPQSECRPCIHWRDPGKRI